MLLLWNTVAAIGISFLSFTDIFLRTLAVLVWFLYCPIVCFQWLTFHLLSAVLPKWSYFLTIFACSAINVPYHWILRNRNKNELHQSIHINYLPVAVLKNFLCIGTKREIEAEVHEVLCKYDKFRIKKLSNLSFLTLLFCPC